MLAAVVVVLVLLAAALLFARVAQHAGLPVPAALVLAGIAAHGMLPNDLQIALTPATLALFLPALIFEGAWTLDVTALRRAAPAVFVLAGPGVVLTTAAIAVAGFGGGLTLAGAFALGAILSATDPVAVLALFRALSLPPVLLTLVEGESIANDGVAVVLMQIAFVFQRTGGFTGPSVWLAAVYAPLAGIVIGVAFALLFGRLLRRFPHPVLEIAVTVAIAYGSYACATFLGASGIFASAAAGIVLPKAGMSEREVFAVDGFWKSTAFLANSAVFLLVGLSLTFERLFHEPLLLLATIVATAAARMALAYGLVPLKRLSGAGLRGWRHAIALAGIRGGLSLALALGLPADFPDRPAIIDAVFAVVFVTLVPGGWILAPLLRRCGIDKPGESAKLSATSAV